MKATFPQGFLLNELKCIQIFQIDLSDLTAFFSLSSVEDMTSIDTPSVEIQPPHCTPSDVCLTDQVLVKSTSERTTKVTEWLERQKSDLYLQELAHVSDGTTSQCTLKNPGINYKLCCLYLGS